MCMNSYAKYYSVANLELKLCDHIHMYTSHNIKNTAALYCVVPPHATKTALTLQGMDSTRPLKVSYGIWHQHICSKSFLSCKLEGGECMVLDLFLQHIRKMLNLIEIREI